jgi:uncharacterized protein YdeI (YjbR/CyaY-like superfamily)
VEAPDGAEVLTFADAGGWQSWLAGHHDAAESVWLLMAKKNSGHATVTPREALEVALCYGWIDSQRRAYDETHYLQRYSPRRARSAWSKVNVELVTELIAARRMRASGLAQVEAAKADGRWDAAYVSQRKAEIPPDLAEALAESRKAKAGFEALGRTDQYLLILSLVKARTAATRAARLTKAIANLESP